MWKWIAPLALVGTLAGTAVAPAWAQDNGRGRGYRPADRYQRPVLSAEQKGLISKC